MNYLNNPESFIMDALNSGFTVKKRACYHAKKGNVEIILFNTKILFHNKNDNKYIDFPNDFSFNKLVVFKGSLSYNPSYADWNLFNKDTITSIDLGYLTRPTDSFLLSLHYTWTEYKDERK